MNLKKLMLLLFTAVFVLGNLPAFGVFAENDSYIMLQLDRTTASVGDIVVAAVKINNIAGFAGYQINIKYDPEVLEAVDPYTGTPYGDTTTPSNGTILNNNKYTVFNIASSDILHGILNFGKSYLSLSKYKADNTPETSGTSAILGFKVKKEEETRIYFEDAAALTKNNCGTIIFDWDNTSLSNYSVIQPPVLNASGNYTPVIVSPSPDTSGTPVNTPTQTPTSLYTSTSTPVYTPTPTPKVSTIVTPDPTPTEKIAVDQTNPPKPGQAPEDLAVSISADKNVYKEQQTVTYVIKYINRLKKTAGDVTIKAEIPQYTTIDDKGDGTVKDNTIEWNMKNLEPNIVRTKTYSVKVGNLDKQEVAVTNNVSISGLDKVQDLSSSNSSIKVMLCSDSFGYGEHNEYVSGYTGNLFKPEKEITRAEIAAMFARILKLDVSKGNKQLYTDVPLKHWASGYISAVSNKGLFKGYSNNTFKPDGSITRAELATAIFRYLELNDEYVPFENHFTDTGSSWAYKYIEEMFRLKIINGYKNNTFLPNGKVKRSEAVTMLNKMLFRGPVNGAVSSFADVPKNHWAVGQIEEAVSKHNYTRNSNGEEILK